MFILYYQDLITCRLTFMNVTDLDGASHERAPLVGLVEDAKHVGRNVLPEIKRLGDASREILHGFAGSTALQ